MIIVLIALVNQNRIKDVNTATVVESKKNIIK